MSAAVTASPDEDNDDDDEDEEEDEDEDELKKNCQNLIQIRYFQSNFVQNWNFSSKILILY